MFKKFLKRVQNGTSNSIATVALGAYCDMLDYLIGATAEESFGEEEKAEIRTALGILSLLVANKLFTEKQPKSRFQEELHKRLEHLLYHCPGCSDAHLASALAVHVRFFQSRDEDALTVSEEWKDILDLKSLPLYERFHRLRSRIVVLASYDLSEPTRPPCLPGRIR